jgi:hypothetical protein
LKFRQLDPLKQGCHAGSMSKKTSKSAKSKRESGDVVQNAYRVFRESIAEALPEPVDAATMSRVMSELGRKGGKVGGAARAASLTKKRRREIAVLGAQKRWANRRESDKI